MKLSIYHFLSLAQRGFTPLEVQPRSVLAKERMLGEAPPAICLSPELKKLPATYFISHIAYET